MRKYFIAILLIVGILFININGVNAICNQTSPDWPDCLGNSSGSGSSSSSSSSSSCVNNCNNSDACKTAPNGQACAQCKAKCQQQANEDKENWEDPTEDFDSDATSNADDATGATSDEAGDRTEQGQEISAAQKYCYNAYEENSEEFLKCIKQATANPDAFTDSGVDVGAIVGWAGKNEYTLDNVGEACSIISDNMKVILSNAFWLISVVGIILVVVMTTIGFVKAIVGSDDEKLRDAFSHLITRIIVVIILLLLPMILTFVINIVNNNFTGTVKIGGTEDGGSNVNVFCDITD